LKLTRNEATINGHLFVYLQDFDVNDVNLLRSPPGGWNATYLNKLGCGINRLCNVDHFRTECDDTLRTLESLSDSEDGYDGYAGGTTWQDEISAYGREFVSYLGESRPEAQHDMYRNESSARGIIDQDDSETVTFRTSDHANAYSLFSNDLPSEEFGSQDDHRDVNTNLNRSDLGYTQGQCGAGKNKNYAELRPNQVQAIV
jgi:hypothetical protein